MKSTHPLIHYPLHCVSLSAIVGLALVVGSCNSERDNAAGSAEESPAAVRSDLPLKTLEISGSDQMKFNIETLEAEAGQPLEVKFINVGTMPKQSMGHNWLLLRLGVDPQEFLEAGFAAASNDYVAAEKEDQVIIRTKILGPGESETLTFNAPSEPGDYPYICTFPGHCGSGMKGVLTVK